MQRLLSVQSRMLNCCQQHLVVRWFGTPTLEADLASSEGQQLAQGVHHSCAHRLGSGFIRSDESSTVWTRMHKLSESRRTIILQVPPPPQSQVCQLQLRQQLKLGFKQVPSMGHPGVCFRLRVDEVLQAGQVLQGPKGTFEGRTAQQGQR